MNAHREDLSWVAGYYALRRGLGVARDRPRLDGSRAYKLKLQMASAERETLEKVQSIVGLGRIAGPYAMANGHRPIYYWSIASHQDVQAFMAMLWCFMPKFQQDNFIETLTKYRQSLRRLNRPRHVSSSDAR